MPGGFIWQLVSTYMPSSEDLDAEAAKRGYAGHQNRLALVEDFGRPSKTAGNMRHKLLSGRLKRGYNPVYWNDSVAVGTVASERNTIDTCIFWMEQEKLRQEGKPHVYVDAQGEV
ncbi:unnamed protein product [Ectocarpus sp. CCAP 1310/34]|nr:unnamed protein product [Ectocarpus sp. CCAP 1310/34]